MDAGMTLDWSQTIAMACDAPVQKFIGQTKRCKFLEENKPPANQADTTVRIDF